MATPKPRKRLQLLFADDEKSLQELMRLELPRLGHDVLVCPDGSAALTALQQQAFDCLLVDLDMPGATGLEVIARAKDLSPDTEAIVLTGKSSLETAIAALRQGAFDYLTKPYRLVELEALLQRVAEKRELSQRCRALQRRLDRLEGRSDLIGRGPAMEAVRALVRKIGPSSATVLIRGETGAGKELVARSLHDHSPRAEQPFVAVNCGALPESLIESELFGHRKGAFTGADEHRVGLFEVADQGTLFLDEIGELPKAVQAKLLRVLESGEIRRVGDNQSHVVDCRIVCATHRNVEEMVAEGGFREDLFFRINTFEVLLPPLRERLEDLPELARHLARRFRGPNVPDEALFAPATLAVLAEHRWPGNVRELANVIEHACILGGGGPLQPEDLPQSFEARRQRSTQLKAFTPVSLRDLELQAIFQALDRHGGNKPKAADELGISLKTLYNKLNAAQQLEQSA